MAPPLLSTFSAVTELFVTAAVYVFVFQAYKNDKFLAKLITVALSYEVLVNIAYMTKQLLAPGEHVEYGAGMSALLAFHGILSLVMFLGLVALVVAAVRQHRRGINLFRQNPVLMWAFVVLWGVSIVTGELVYVLLYLV